VRAADVFGATTVPRSGNDEGSEERDMSAIRHVLLVFAIALSVALTGAWDGLVAYGLFRLVSSAF
jgi:hypothetical protein